MAKKIKKIKVTNGVFWIEVPEAEVFVLCGCPADSVKHLKKLRLIETKKQLSLIEQQIARTIDEKVKEFNIFDHLCKLRPDLRRILLSTFKRENGRADSSLLNTKNDKDNSQIDDDKVNRLADKFLVNLKKETKIITLYRTMIESLFREPSLRDKIKLKLEIKKNHENPVTYETGPNVILLSDKLMQNGKFANLSEFPVLQMLYKQGMKLPNHLNNTGEKPILIGKREQVEAQMQYVKRGNYGLFNKKEIEACDIDGDTAEEMMKLKLAFAFGEIKHSDKLLDIRKITDAKSVEIKNEVFIRRLEPNKFEFEYKNQRTTVDLNLKKDEKYKPAYPLNFHQIEREYFAVIHSGEGDGWNPNHPCMASILMYRGKIYLIDAGPNIFDTLYALGISVNEIEGIFHTHIHDDHFAGIAELMLADHKIKYYASKLVQKSMRLKLAALFGFEGEGKELDHYFDFKPLELNHWNDLEGLQVMPVFSPHPVETNIYFFRTFWESDWKQYAHLADILHFKGLKEKLSEANYNKIREYYLMPVDIKKIDVGGYPIHGDANDFKNDRSGKILLSHFSDTLKNKEKEIGAGAPFGTMDTLIHTDENYPAEKAFEYLQTYFLKDHDSIYNQLTVLASNPIKEFIPESFLIKEGEISEYIYLILTGNVEQIQTEENLYNMLTAGALIGEMPGLADAPSFITYRAVNFVQALQLPVKQYAKFIEDNSLNERIENLYYKRKFLMQTKLFGKSVSYAKLNKLAALLSKDELPYPKNSPIDQKADGKIWLIKKGKIILKKKSGKGARTLKKYDFFHEEVMFNEFFELNLTAEEDTEIVRIPSEELEDIPIVRWKLQERYLKNKKLHRTWV